MPLAAFAHSFKLAGDSLGFWSGLIDPFTSMDHILAMLAIGLWLPRTPKLWAYILPVILVILIVAGAAMTLMPIGIPYATYVLYFWTLFLGLLLVSKYRLFWPIEALVVGFFALFHGYNHAFEVLLDLNNLLYTIGFAMTAWFLMVSGFWVSKLYSRLDQDTLNRWLGGGH